MPKYGIEAVIVLKGDTGELNVEEGTVKCGDTVLHDMERVLVRISVNETNEQRPRIAVELLEPKMEGLSVDFDLSSEQGKAKEG